MSKYDNLRLKECEEVPTYELLEKILGESFETYEIFQEALASFEIEQDWQYYACSCKSWMARGQYRWTTPRGTSKEKTIYWLSAWDGFFKVMIWFLEKNRNEILKENLSEETKQKICDAKTLGKMNTFPLEFEMTSAKPLADIYSLIRCKKQLEAK